MINAGDATNLAADAAEWVLGIDPGAAGGFARRALDGSDMEVWRMPTKAKGGNQAIVELVHEILKEWGCGLIVIEHVWGREGDGKRQITTFMKHVGLLEGAIRSALIDTAYDMPEIRFVAPTVWQKALGCPKAPTKKEEPSRNRRKTIHKNNLRDYAQEKFEMSLTLCTADAALIAEYGRHQL